MKTKFDSYKERATAVKPYFEDYLNFARKLRNAFTKRLKNVEVYIFGSVLEKKHSVYHSDIDLLVVSPDTPHYASDRALIKRGVFEEVGFSDPFEVHLVTPEEYEGWYKHLIKKKKRV